MSGPLAARHRAASPSGPGERLRTLLPGRADYAGLSRSWRGDLLAGVTVGIVALPLALGFGVVSGVGAAAGLVTAVVAGVVAAVFGGSHLQVSGPTGAMAVVLVPVVAQHGPGSVAAVAMLAGVLVLAAGVLRLGRVVNHVPWPVVEGFTAGIAVIIFLQQVPSALDTVPAPGETALAAALAAVRDVGGGAVATLLVVVAVAAIMVGLPRVRRGLPASLIAVVLTTAAVAWWGTGVPLIGVIPSSLPAPSLPGLDLASGRALLSAAVAVAALAALESLLSARVSDGMTDTRQSDPDRELVGQGLANVASGLFGGLPATGAIARTAVNVRAGGRTRLASLSHAVLLLLVVLLISPVVSRIPLAALAGVLMVTAVRMLDRHRIRSVLRSTRADAVVFGLTAVVTVGFDLVLAVELGIALAVVLALRSVSQSSGASYEEWGTDHDVVDDDTERALMHESIAIYRFDGALFFGAAQRFLEELSSVSDVRVLVLRLGGVRVLDASGARVLGEIIDDLQGRGIVVLVKGVPSRYRALLDGVGVTARLAGGRHLFDDLDEAIAHARSLALAGRGAVEGS